MRSARKKEDGAQSTEEKETKTAKENMEGQCGQIYRQEITRTNMTPCQTLELFGHIFFFPV